MNGLEEDTLFMPQEKTRKLSDDVHADLDEDYLYDLLELFEDARCDLYRAIIAIAHCRDENIMYEVNTLRDCIKTLCDRVVMDKL